MADDQPVRRKPLWPAIPALVVLGAVAAALIYGINQQGKTGPAASAESPSPEEDARSRGSMFNTPFYSPGIRQPPTYSADAVPLAEDAQVIGVQVGGKHRAYRIEAFNGMSSHIVNDLVGNVPLSVTHCDRTNCTRVFRGETPGKPLSIDLGGFSRGNMLLKFNNDYYDQETGRCTAPGRKDLDLPKCEFVQMTWKEWKQQHPDTDIYLAPPDRK